MQIIGQLNPSLGPNSFETGNAANGGTVILHNLSAIDLMLQFGDDATEKALLPAWVPREFDFCGKTIAKISYSALGATQQINSPSTLIIGEAYMRGEPVPKITTNYTRLANVGNPTLPNNSTSVLDNEDQPPASRFIYAIPSDQSVPSLGIVNDGSGYWNILSSGILRSVLSIIRGTATAEAQVVLGDASDPSMLVVHGQVDSAAQAGQAQNANVAQTANTLTVYDGSATVLRQINEYEGTTDPSTYLTPNEGDRWYAG